MAAIRLLLDEDVWPGLAEALRKAGYDAVSVHEFGQLGFSDTAQLDFAIAENRAIISHNIRDFVPLAQAYAQDSISHSGIIVAVHFDKGTLVRRTLHLLDSLTLEQLSNSLRFV